MLTIPPAIDKAIDETIHDADVVLADRIRSIVAAISYRRDWVFGVRMRGEKISESNPVAVPHVSVVALWYAPDSNTGEYSEGANAMAVPYSASDDEVIRALFILISELEDHERMEKFKHQGQRYFKPHGQDGQGFAVPFGFRLPTKEWGAVNPEVFSAIKAQMAAREQQ